MKTPKIFISMALAFVGSSLIPISPTPFTAIGHALTATRVQLGSDIDGLTAGEWTGAAVAMSNDGTRVAIGAPYFSTKTGQVRVMDFNGSEWSQVGPVINGAATNEEFGTAVALSANGTRVAIGAPSSNKPGAQFVGKVRIYQLSNGAWVQLGVDIVGEADRDYSGRAIALSDDGTRLAIGAYKNDGNGADSGNVRVYQLNGSTWDRMGADINGVAAGDEFGWSVAMSSDGTRIAIGAIKHDSGRGHVRVLDFNGSDWIPVGNDMDGAVPANQSFAGDQFGSSVAMSSDGNRVAISAIAHDGQKGHVRVFDLNGVTWEQIGEDIDGEATVDRSGRSISLSADGTRLAIGARENDGNGADSGHVRLYQLIDNIWEQVGDDIDGETAGDWSGTTVALSADGTRFAIGAYLNDGTSGSASDNRGHVRVFGVRPVAPSITAVTEGDGSLSVAFTPGADNGLGVTNYKYSTDGNAYVALNPASTSSPFIITGLTAGTAYSITIKAVNAVGDSVASNAVSGTPQTTTTTIAPTTTTAAISVTAGAVTNSSDTVVSRVKKLDALPKTGGDTSTLLLISALALSAGLMITLRRRIVQ